MRAAWAVVVAAVAVLAAGCGRPPIGEAVHQGRPPRIRPDYAGVTLPPNVAPLNFAIEEPGASFAATISSSAGRKIDVAGRGAKIVIPPRAWRALLRANRGQAIRFECFVKQSDGRWFGFEPLENRVAPEPIDRYLVYRQIDPAYNYWRSIGLEQRDLQGYGERCLLHSRMVGEACLNCHSFPAGRTGQLVIGVRGSTYGAGTVLYGGGRATKLATKFGYTAWHPSGRIIMYVDNQVRQFFHSAAHEVRDVVDLASDLAYYDLAANAVKSIPALARPDRLETYPTWSPDGRWLYYCSAVQPWANRHRVPPEHYDQCRYDLLRISYDIATDHWGEPQMVLSAQATGKSALLPRVSPDGRFLLFCLCNYGCFPIYQPSSDLYLMDLASGKYHRLSINSDRSESWHSWSSNSRWIAFSSKRRDGLFTRTYLSYVAPDGTVAKPLLVPQKDPTFYDSFLKTYSVPELVAEPVRASPRQLAEAVRAVTPLKPVDLIPHTQEDRAGGRTGGTTEPWRQAR